MNRWGIQAWDNKAAAHWLVSINESDNLDVEVFDALHLDVVEYREEVRAAAALLVLLIEVDRWHQATVESGLELAISRLEEICDKQLFSEEPELLGAIRHEIGVLRARLLTGSDRHSASARSLPIKRTG